METRGVDPAGSGRAEVGHDTPSGSTKGPSWWSERSHHTIANLGALAATGWSKVGRRTAFGLILAALVAGAAVIILAREGAALSKHSFQLNLPMVALSVAVSYGGLLLAIIVWHRILASFGIHHPFRMNWRIYSYSVVGVALPGSIWPLAGRTILYQRLGESPLRVAAATVVESAMIGVAAMSVYAAGVLLQPGTSLWARPGTGVIAAVIALILMCPPVFNWLSRGLQKRSKQLGEPVLVNYRAVDLVAWLVAESAMVVIGGVSLFLLLGSLGPMPPELLPRLIVAWAAAAAVGNLLFWLPATSLLRDGALILALTPALPTSVAIMFAVLARVWSIGALLALAGLTWLLLDGPFRWGRRVS